MRPEKLTPMKIPPHLLPEITFRVMFGYVWLCKIIPKIIPKSPRIPRNRGGFSRKHCDEM